MLNYLIAMKRTWLLLALICLSLAAASSRVFARQEYQSPGQPVDGPAILAPLAGQALQGTVRIVASAGGENFQTAEIGFAYVGDTTGAWFLIDERSQPLNADTPVEWDTSRITDGDYNLRLLVTYTDGSQQSVQVSGVRVRNYTAVETDTPAPAVPVTTAAPTPQESAAAPAATQAATQPTQAQIAPATPEASPTPALAAPASMPEARRNPVALPAGMVWLSVMRGVLAAFGAFALLGLYDLLRRIEKR